MATQAYFQWVAAGKPWRLATPIAELVSWAKANGVTNLGTIGNDAHLTADYPQDHTPFSYTAWPVPLPGYVVCAIDLGNDRGLGQAILTGAKAGKYPWLKYMNFGGQHYDSREGWQPEPNPDYHVHLSIRTDWIDRSIGTFNPWGTQMGALDDRDAAIGLWRVEALATDSEVVRGGPTKGEPMGVMARLHRMEAQLKALADRPPVQAAPVDIAALVEALRPLVRAEVRAAFADGGRTE